MSAAEIIEELPKLTEADRRAIRGRLLELEIGEPEVEACELAAIQGAQLLDRLEEGSVLPIQQSIQAKTTKQLHSTHSQAGWIFW